MRAARALPAATCAALVACAGTGAVRAPGVPQAPAVAQLDAHIVAESAAVARLIEEGTQRSRVADDLAYLTDVIGPRLTGSPAMRRANEWAARKLIEYGADTAALEPWPFGIGWQRGPINARILAPHERWISAASWAWSPGTRGALAGDVVYVDAATRADYEQRFAGRLRGAWVMLSPSTPLLNPDAPSAADSARVDSLRRVQRAASAATTPARRAFLDQRGQLLLRDSIAGILIDGGKDFGLFVMAGSPDAVSAAPQIVVANETYAEFHRLRARGERVRLEVNAVNTFGRDTLVQWNTVAELRGSERPDEVVILGAHLDSWDIGTGATDNGTGAVAVIEAARLLGTLKAAGIRPRRTIRFVLFSGEEQGLLGSQYYVQRHEKELARVQAVLVLDNGTGRIQGIAVQGWEQLHDLWRRMLQPLAALGPFVVRSGMKTGTDHLPFLEAGVPAFNYDQLSRGYNHTWHSQVDVFDHAVPSDVAQAATVMAVNALQLADLDTLLPRRK